MKARIAKVGNVAGRSGETGEDGTGARAASWLAWSLWIVCVSLVALMLLLDLTTPPATTTDEPVPMDVLFALLILAYSTVGAFVASRRPTNPIGWIFCGAGLLIGFDIFGETCTGYLISRGNGPVSGMAYLAWLFGQLAFLAAGLSTVLLLLFPSGRLPSGLLLRDGGRIENLTWRTVMWAAVIGSTLVAFWIVLDPVPEYHAYYVDNPLGVGGSVGRVVETLGVIGVSTLPLSGLFAGAALVSRLILARGDERQQLKWLAYAVAVLVVGFLTAVLLGGSSDLGWTVGVLVGILGFMFLPVAVGVAILKYRLYDIDLIINRTLVYGLLTACVVGFYVLVVGGAGALFQGRVNLLVSLLATGLIALLFHPLRVRLQRGVNRLMYGQRDEPYAVLSRLGRRLETTLAPNAVLPAVARTLREALRLSYAEIQLERNGEFKTAAVVGCPAERPFRVPLVHGGRTVGKLLLGARPGEESFGPADRRLLKDLAQQIAVAAHAARLTADLQRSRERLVVAREEERRRLRRDLHDGVGPQLAALMLELETAGELVSDDPEASALMAKLSERTRDIVSDVRRSVHALRPPSTNSASSAP